ncbi:hypothetical protein LEP1GSC170_5610 [Leptospira interrogans serovar Bataviae str. HAI135]|nr:hypothetical protein LEP1GSC170_5610 [Leptospira interrogans serovar Bataviae str. HAI135]
MIGCLFNISSDTMNLFLSTVDCFFSSILLGKNFYILNIPYLKSREEPEWIYIFYDLDHRISEVF